MEKEFPSKGKPPRHAPYPVQEDVAAKLGVERTTVYRWESGETLPRPWTRPGLAQLLDLDNHQLAALLDGASYESIRTADVSGQPLSADQSQTSDQAWDANAEQEAGLSLPATSDLSIAGSRDPASVEDDVRRRPLLEGILVGAGSALGATVSNNLGQLERVRRSLDCLLEGSDVGGSTLERWDGLPGEYGQRYQVVAPARLLDEVASDFVELRYLLGRKRTTGSRIALCRVSSQLASLAGIFLAAQGDKRSAQNWFYTAGLAAREAADGRLAGLALVRSGIVYLYHGAPERALVKLAKAQALLGNAPNPWRARALVAEARAQAMLGKRQEAQRRLGEAEIAFGDMPAAALGDPALGYTERQFYWTVSNAYTYLGKAAEAEHLQQRALGMYRPDEYLDPALIRLDQSRCLASQGDMDCACQKAIATITAVPAEHRGLVSHYGRSFFGELPHFAGATTFGRELKELLAQPASL